MLAPKPFEAPVFTTRPILPSLADFTAQLEPIWRSRWLTNRGPLHQELSAALARLLRVEHMSLVTNATTGLSLACQALDLNGEVITTPFTFPATVNILKQAGLEPVFADIDPHSMTLAPEAIEEAITERTSAILAVHVYGLPCSVLKIQDIARRHSLKVIYDAAHAFGTELDGVPISKFGDASVYSFHASKLYHTAEGGAVVTQSLELSERVELLANFGIRNETTVDLPGINGKMNEIQAALGLCNLPLIDDERAGRDSIGRVYCSRIDGRDGIMCVRPPGNVRNSHQYFVVRISGGSIRRDYFYEELKKYNVFSRRYFYPLCSEYPFLQMLPSAMAENIPVSHHVSSEVLCLPYYSSLGTEGAHRVCDIIKHLAEEYRAS